MPLPPSELRLARAARGARGVVLGGVGEDGELAVEVHGRRRRARRAERLYEYTAPAHAGSAREAAAQALAGQPELAPRRHCVPRSGNVAVDRCRDAPACRRRCVGPRHRGRCRAASVGGEIAGRCASLMRSGAGVPPFIEPAQRGHRATPVLERAPPARAVVHEPPRCSRRAARSSPTTPRSTAVSGALSAERAGVRDRCGAGSPAPCCRRAGADARARRHRSRPARLAAPLPDVAGRTVALADAELRRSLRPPAARAATPAAALEGRMRRPRAAAPVPRQVSSGTPRRAPGAPSQGAGGLGTCHGVGLFRGGVAAGCKRCARARRSRPRARRVDATPGR